MSNARGRLIVCAAAMLGMLGIAGCARTPNYVTSPSQASRILQAYNRANAQANFTLNTALENQNAEGVSAEIDDADYQLLRDESKTSDGNGKPWRYHATTYVFNQATTPAYFVAVTGPVQGQTGGGWLYLFRKDTVKSPWRVLYEISLSPKEALPEFVSAGNGYVAAGPLPKSLVASPSAAIGDVVNYWSDYTTATTPLGLLQSGAYTSGWNAESRGSVAQYSHSHIAGATSFSQDSSPIIAFPTKTGALVFGAIDQSTSYTLNPGWSATQPATRSDWTALLAPGTYTEITFNGITQVALSVPRHGRIAVLGGYSGVISGSGS